MDRLPNVGVFNFAAPSHIQQYALSGLPFLNSMIYFALIGKSSIRLPSLISLFARCGHFMRWFYQWPPIMSIIWLWDTL